MTEVFGGVNLNDILPMKDVLESRNLLCFKHCVCFVPSVHGGVESGVDATEPYSSGRKQSKFEINLLVNML